MKRYIASIGLVLTVILNGCSSGSTSLVAQFTPSATAPSPGLVKMVQHSRSGQRVIVDVVLFGPEPTLDLNAFQFGVKNGNSDLVKFVPSSTFAQTVLVADTGQTISIDVDGTSDPSLVQINVAKLGGGDGNGTAAASAIVIELPFDVQASGATTLTLVGLGANLPLAIDSSRAPIAAVRFDVASASVMGVTTGGSGY